MRRNISFAVFVMAAGLASVMSDGDSEPNPKRIEGDSGGASSEDQGSSRTCPNVMLIQSSVEFKSTGKKYAMNETSDEVGKELFADHREEAARRRRRRRRRRRSSSPQPSPSPSGGGGGYRTLDGDCHGNNIREVKPGTLESCKSACDAESSCRGFSIMPNSGGGCYLKSSSCSNPTEGKWKFVVKIGGGGGSPSPSPIPSDDRRRRSRPPPSPRPSPVPSGGGAAYRQLDGDCNGNNIREVKPATMEKCKSACDAESSCRGFSIMPNSGGGCYLKSASCSDPRKGKWKFVVKSAGGGGSPSPSPSPEERRREARPSGPSPSPRRRQPSPRGGGSPSPGGKFDPSVNEYRMISGDCKDASDIKKVSAGTKDRCASECDRTPNCNAFSLHSPLDNSPCTLKRATCDSNGNLYSETHHTWIKGNGWWTGRRRYSIPGYSPTPSHRGNRVMVVDMPGRVEMFPKVAHGLLYPTKIAASKRDPDLAFIAWTEEGNTGGGGNIHLTKLSVSGGRVLKDRVYRGYDRAGGLDTTPDGRIGMICTRRVPRWEQEYYRRGKGDNPGKVNGHWSSGEGNAAPMLVGMCEVKEDDLSDSTPKWLLGKFWNQHVRSGKVIQYAWYTYGVGGNYPVNYWFGYRGSGSGEVYYYKPPDDKLTTGVFGDLGESWMAWYGTTSGSHTSQAATVMSDERYRNLGDKDGRDTSDGGKVRSAHPNPLQDGMVVRTKAHSGKWSGSLRLRHGHPQGGLVAQNDLGYLAWCHRGEGRGMECVEIRKERGCDRKFCEEPRETRTILFTVPSGKACSEEQGAIMARPGRQGWVYVWGKKQFKPCKRHENRRDKLEGTLGDPKKEWVAYCMTMKLGEDVGDCQGHGTGGSDKVLWDEKALHCRRNNRAVQLNPPGTQADAYTVKGARLGVNKDRYLAGYKLRDSGDFFVVEVDGECNIKKGPTKVEIDGVDGPYYNDQKTPSPWGDTMQWSTTRDGKVVSVNGVGPGKNKALVMVHECESC